MTPEELSAALRLGAKLILTRPIGPDHWHAEVWLDATRILLAETCAGYTALDLAGRGPLQGYATDAGFDDHTIRARFEALVLYSETNKPSRYDPPRVYGESFGVGRSRQSCVWASDF